MTDHPGADRRSAERLAADMPVRLCTGRHTQNGRSIDVSGEGACVRCDTSLLSVGDRVTFLAGAVSANGAVAWKGMDRVGIRFDDPIDRDRLEAFASGRT